jgi:DnaJ homolog subfamily A member 2
MKFFSIVFHINSSFSQLQFEHLDGRHMIMKTKPGDVIQSEVKLPDSEKSMPYMMKVPKEGMPSRGNPFVKGDLYVVFHIDFPKSLSPEITAKLKELLPDAVMEAEYNSDEVEECFLERADLRHFGKGGAEISGNDDDSDDEAPGNVQCQQS